MADFLFEIGLEEIPARMIAGAQAELEQRVVGMLERERLVGAGVAAAGLSTPRRLAVRVQGVASRQQDIAEEMVGPPLKVAYKDGVATPAAIAFAKKAGVTLDDLKTASNAKGEYLAASVVKTGRSATEVIAEELPKELVQIYWAKNMYWRARKPERFVRPVRWLAALLDDAVVPVEFAGYTAGAVTYGHRVLHGSEPIKIGAPQLYEDALKQGFVIADVEVRRQKIRKALDAVTRTVPRLRWREDHELVDKLTHLTEWPSVLMGGFEPEYLALPEEVLVTVMRDHQGYFAVEDEDGKLAPHFLAVLNTETDEAGLAVIRHGNERVLRARFNDARFFWEFDQRVPLVERSELLSHLTFHTRLGLQGSYAVKMERLEKLTRDLVHLPESNEEIPVISNVDDFALSRAVKLSKSDLTTELVKEFTELQGQIGALYAQTQGESIKTGKAIYDQYLPKYFGDKIPSTLEGAILAIADRADTISGMFAVGLEPTGSKDPLGLRRAANGIIQILAETPTSLDRSLSFIAKRACAAYGSQVVTSPVADHPESNVKPIDQVALSNKVSAFLRERLEFYLREAKRQAYDVVKAVLASGADDVRDAVARAEAVTAVRGSADFAAVSAAFKRMKNILSQANEKGILVGERVDPALLIDPVEKALAERSAELAERVSSLRARKNYAPALEQIATLRPQVDSFFEAVMVMAPEPAIRANRLALLKRVLGDFSGIADFSEIVVAG